MKDVRRCARWAVVVAVGAPALGCALAGLWAGVAAFAALGAAWLLGSRRARWAASLGLVASTVAAVPAAVQGVGGGWLLLGVTAALVAWDLEALAGRLQSATRVDDEAGLVRRHRQRILLAVSLGLLLGGVALLLRVQLSFWPALGLALLAVWGMGRLLHWAGQPPPGRLPEPPPLPEPLGRPATPDDTPTT